MGKVSTSNSSFHAHPEPRVDRRPSPPHPRGWPLSWIKPVLQFPEDRMNKLRGVDATLYIRFLRGCFWFALLQTLTTLPILLPIHVTFSDGTVSPKSMTRASISSLVSTEKGLSLLWVHIILMFWIAFSWFGTLYWICRGAFHYRAQNILAAANQAASETSAKERSQYDPHPHPQYPFHSLAPLEEDHSTRGLRLRTVMVTNIPHGLRSEKDLKEYFEYYLSRGVARPAIGITSSTQFCQAAQGSSKSARGLGCSSALQASLKVTLAEEVSHFLCVHPCIHAHKRTSLHLHACKEQSAPRPQ